MTVTRESLLQHFQLLNDHELLAQFQSGELTAFAKEVAAEELQRRNLDLSKPTGKRPGKSQAVWSSDDLVCVARYSTASEAYMLQNRLELEGIPAVVTDDHMAQVMALIAVGGVRVLVPEAYLQRAGEIAAAIERGDYALDDQTDLG